MKLTIHVDDGLLREATVASNIVNQTELIRAALEALIAQSYEEQAAPQPSSGLEPIEDPAGDTPAPAEPQAESPPEVEEEAAPTTEEAEEEALPEFVDDNTVIEGISPEPAAPTAAAENTTPVTPKKVTIDVAPQAPKEIADVRLNPDEEHFFGEFLTSNNKLKSEQLGSALELVQSKNKKLGDLAIERGMVTSQQANDLNRKQREVDKPFGMLAVEAGLMTEEQVQTLLKVQKETKLTLAKAIADLKLLDIDSLNRALHTFKAQQPTADPREAMAQYLDGSPVGPPILESFKKGARRVGGLDLKFGRVSAMTSKLIWDCTVSIGLIGDQPLNLYLSVNEDFADLILRKIFGDEMAESEYAPDFEDALAEFLTITAAGIVKNLEEEGHAFKMGKPEFTPDMPDTGCAIPLVSTDGNGTLFLAPS